MGGGWGGFSENRGRENPEGILRAGVEGLLHSETTPGLWRSQRGGPPLPWLLPVALAQAVHGRGRCRLPKPWSLP